jgi:hypothetical protein
MKVIGTRIALIAGALIFSATAVFAQSSATPSGPASNPMPPGQMMGPDGGPAMMQQESEGGPSNNRGPGAPRMHPGMMPPAMYGCGGMGAGMEEPPMMGGPGMMGGHGMMMRGMMQMMMSDPKTRAQILEIQGRMMKDMGALMEKRGQELQQGK